MTTLPDPTSIDWEAVVLWGGGIGTVVGTITGAIWLGLKQAIKVAEGLPQPPAEIHRTDVYTTDSIALRELANAIEAGNVLMTEGNALRREATDERRTLRQALDENTEVTEKNVAAMTELRNDVRRLTDELIRAGRLR